MSPKRAHLGDLLRRDLNDHLSLGNSVAFLDQNVSNGHVVFGGDNGWLPEDQTLGPQIEICAEENVEHPDAESDERQKVRPFDRRALHDSSLTTVSTFVARECDRCDVNIRR
jgi:hypothetical protein